MTLESFTELVTEWRSIKNQIDSLEEKTNDIEIQLDQIFEDVVRREGLLSNLNWEIRHSSSLICELSDKAVADFLNQLEWHENTRWHHHTLEIGKTNIYFNDGEMEIPFPSYEKLIEFCHEFRIKPDYTHISSKLEQLTKNRDELADLVNAFSVSFDKNKKLCQDVNGHPCGMNSMAVDPDCSFCHGTGLIESDE